MKKLNEMTVKELREEAKKVGVKNYSNFTKQMFIEEIRKAQEVLRSKEEKPKKVKFEKTYFAESPKGEKFDFPKKGLLFEFATGNGICNKGWVDKSIRENIPVKIGINKERKSQKYNGNGWKFYMVEEEVK